MKIQYLGTAAAEGIPALFCNCVHCTYARQHGGKDIRTRSQALIDDELLVDFPADTLSHCNSHGLDLTKIKHCLITHTHSDHLYLDDLVMRFPVFSNLGRESAFVLCGDGRAMEDIDNFIKEKELDPKGIIETKVLELYKAEAVGNFKVISLRAYHDERAFPVFYIIENAEGKRIMYAHDTNYFYDEVWEYLEKNPIRLDFVSLDCCSANEPVLDYVGHMNLNDNVKTKNRLIEIGCADGKTIFCANHFSHNGKDVLYKDFSKAAEKENFLTSYDGMICEF